MIAHRIFFRCRSCYGERMTFKTSPNIGDPQSGRRRGAGIGGKLVGLDGRSAAAKSISRLIRGMVSDLGGIDGLSEQKRVLVALTAREAVLLDSVDLELLRSPDGPAKRRRAYLELLANRQRISASLTRHLRLLGLQRIEAEMSLSDYLAQRATEPEANNHTNAAQGDSGPEQ